MAAVLFNQLVGDDYWHLRVVGDAEHVKAQPGQFFHLDCPDAGGRLGRGRSYLRRPMSVYAVDREARTVDFLYKVTGVGTAGLATLKTGGELDLFGPLGVGFSVPKDASHALLVARGAGLATMGPLVTQLVAHQVAVTAICSFRSPDAAVGMDPFQRTGVTVLPVYDTADPGSGQSSEMQNLEQLITRSDQKSAISAVYTCGSKRIASMLNQLPCLTGVFSQIALEQRMACGLGMCHACVVDVRVPGTADRDARDTELDSQQLESGRIVSKRVCCEGPVFRLGQVTL